MIHDLNDGSARASDAELDAALAGQGGQFSRGIRSGALNLGASVANAAGAIGNQMGYDQFGRSAYATADDLNRQAQAAAPRITSFRDIGAPGGQGYFQDAVDWGAGTLGSVVPSAALGIGAGLLAPASAGVAGAMAAGTAAYALPEIGDVVGRQREAGQQVDLGQAALTGGGSAALGSIVPGMVGAKVAGRMASTAPMTLRRAGATLAGEGVLEGGTEAGGDALKQMGAGRTLDSLDSGQLVDSFAGGVLGGGAMSGVGVAGEYAHGKAGAVSEGLGAAKNGATGLLASAKDKLQGAGKAVADAAEPLTDAASNVAGQAKGKLDGYEIPDRLSELWSSSRTKAKDMLRKVADSEDIVGDVREFAGAQGDKFNALMAGDDGKRGAAVKEWADGLMKENLSPEQQAQVQDWMANPGDRTKQAAVAGLKMARDKAKDFGTKLQGFAQNVVNKADEKKGVKKSEDYSGARAAIMQEVIPVLQESHPELLQHGDTATLNKLSDTLRHLVGDLSVGEYPSGKAMEKLIDLLGPNTDKIVEAAYRAVNVTGKGDAAKVFRGLNQIVEAQKTQGALTDTLRKNLKPEFQRVADNSMLLNDAEGIAKWAETGRSAGQSDEQFKYLDRKFREEMAKRYTNPDAVIAAVEARRGRAKENVIADESRANKTDSDNIGIESDLADPASDMREITLDDGVDSTLFFGKGGKELYEDPTGNEQVTGRDGTVRPHATLQAVERAKTAHPEKAVQFRSAKELGMDHPLIAKRLKMLTDQLESEGRSPEEARALGEQAISKYGAVTAESARNEQSISTPEIEKLKFETHKYDTGPARFDTKGRGVEGNVALDGIKITRWAEGKSQEHYTERDDKGYKFRKARMFMEGVAAIQDRLGHSFEIPDSTQITAGRDGQPGLTWGEVKNLKALGENSEKLSQRAQGARETFSTLTAGRPMRRDGTLGWYPKGSEKAKALRKAEWDMDTYRERADRAKAAEMIDEATRADGGRPDNRTIQEMIDSLGEGEEGVAQALREKLNGRAENNTFENSVDDPNAIVPDVQGDDVVTALRGGTRKDAEVRSNASGFGRSQDGGGLSAGDMSQARFGNHRSLNSVDLPEGHAIRPANKRQQNLIGEAVSALRTAFHNQLDNVQFAVHGDEGAPAGRIYYDEDGATTISLRADILRGTDMSNEKAPQRLKRVIAHELSHELDRQSGWESERVAALQPGGKVFEEARTAADADPRLKALYAKILDGTRPDAKNARELYAQLNGLYQSHPELMSEHQPIAYAALERQTSERVAAYGASQAQSVSDRQRAAEGNRTSAPSGQDGAARRADGLGRVVTDRAGADYGRTPLTDPQSEFEGFGEKTYREQPTLDVDNAEALLPKGARPTQSGPGQGATKGPKAVAAKKAALKDAASSGDPALVQELRTSDDAAGLQRAVTELLKGTGEGKTNDAIDEANARLSELVRDNPDVSYSLMRDHQTAQSGVGPQDRRGVYEYVKRVLGDKIYLAWKDILHAGEFQRITMPDGSHEDVIRLSIHSLNPLSTAHHEALHGFFERLRDIKQGGVMDVLDRAASSAPVMNQLKKLLAGHPEALKQLGDAEERAAYMYQFWAAGKLTIGDHTRNVFQRIADFVRSVLGIWSNDERALHILDYFHQGEFAKDSTKQFARDVINEKLMTQGRNAALESAKRMTQPFREIGESLAVAGGARLRDTGIPALRELADAMKLHGTAEGEDVGFLPAARAARTQVMNDLGAKLKGASQAALTAALESLQTKSNASIDALTSPEARLAARMAKKEIRKTLDSMYKYMQDRGVDVDDLGVGKDYFPRQYDASFISGHQAEFKAVLAKHGVSNPDNVMKKIIGAEGAEFTVEVDKPGMQALKARTLAHIPDAELAPFMRKNVFEIMNSYITQATRRGEWADRFGDKNQRIDGLMQQAQREGATPEQMKAAQNFIRSVDGTLGDTINPEARRLIGNMIVYQNIRLLPLAIFSSVVDPLGVVVRGGTVREGFETFKRGMRETVKNFKKEVTDDEMTKLAASIGVIDDTTLVHTLGALYSQGMVGDTGRKINDTFFRYNLIEQFNTSMRVGATEAALNFIKRHADGSASKHSERWLQELGLQKGSVKLDANGRPDVSDPVIKMAVNRWVDGAVLRPDAVDKPIWMSDPHFALIAHLKQFVFSFHETILKRVGHEFDHGNYAPAMALASYVPVMMAADFMKGLIQGGGDQPEWKQNWELSDWVQSGIERGGLYGTGQFAVDAFKDIHRGGSGIGALVGPTLEQLTDAVRVVGGREQFGHFALKSMPANALYAKALGGEATDPKYVD